MEYREAIREYLHNCLLFHPCVSCGETDPIVLEFHHLHSKETAIAQMVTRVKSIERIEGELKNEVRKLTAKGRGWFRGRK